MLPNKGAKSLYLRALQWTDTRGDDETETAEYRQPAQYDPFVSLSSVSSASDLAQLLVCVFCGLVQWTWHVSVANHVTVNLTRHTPDLFVGFLAQPQGP